MAALAKRIQRLHERAEALWKKDEMESRIDRLTKYYHPPEDIGEGTMTDDGHVVHVNKVYPRVRTAMSSLYAKRPEVLTRGRRVQDDAAAKNAELMLNYLTRFMKYPAELREWLFWSRLTMYGIVKLGMETKGEMLLPMMRAVDPRSFRCDPMTESFRPSEGNFQAFKMRRSFSALRQSGLYEEKRLDKLWDRMFSSADADDADEDTTDIWLWENYIRDGKDIIVATSADGYAEHGFSQDEKVWIREEGFTRVIGLPGRCLFFIPSPRTWNPVSPVGQWLPQQQEINGYRTQKLIHAERANSKVLVDPAMFASPEELSQLESPEPRQFVPVSNAGGKIDKAMYEINYKGVNQDVWAGEQEADITIQEIDGVGSVQLGRSEPERGSVSATRDQLAENALRLRASDNAEIWEDALDDVYQALLNLAQQQMKGSLWIKITGNQEVQISAKEIQGDIDVIMSFGSTQPKDRESEWTKAKELYELLAPNPGVNQNKNLRELLNKADVRGIDGWMAALPAPPPAPPVSPMDGMTGAGGQMPFGPELLNDLALGGIEGGQTALGSAATLRNQT